MIGELDLSLGIWIVQLQPPTLHLRLWSLRRRTVLTIRPSFTTYNTCIDAKLKQDANAEKNDIKLLLLGAGESGKTTIKMQMRYIEGNPPTEEENEQFSALSSFNSLMSM